MKLRVSKESVVYQGPAYEDTIWGVVQFPEIVNRADGTLAIKIHVGDDVWTDFGKDKDVWCVSRDNGVTWERADISVKSEVNYNTKSTDDAVVTNDITLTFDKEQSVTVYNSKNSDQAQASKMNTTNKALTVAVEYGGAALIIVE